MIILTTCSSRAEALIIKSKLESYDVYVLLSGDDLGGLHPALAQTRGIKILVQDSNFEKAKDILSSIRKKCHGKGA